MDPNTTIEPLHDFIPDVTKVTTAYPCPIEGEYVYQLTACEPALGKVAEGSDDKDPNKKMWKLTWTSCMEAVGVDNNTIQPGYKVTEHVLLYQPEQKPGKQEFKWMEALARRYDALFGTDDNTRPEQYADLRPGIGRKVVLKLKPKEGLNGQLQPEIRTHKVAPAGA